MNRFMNPGAGTVAAFAFICFTQLPAQEFQYRIPQAELVPKLQKLIDEEERPAFEDFLRIAQPAGGELVTSIVSGSLAEQFGLMPGDIVASINGNAVWTRAAKDRQSSDTGRMISWAPPGGRTFTETVPPGLFGYHYSSGYFRPEQLYISKAELHQATWNEWVTAALGALIRDPDFAESAWAEAIRLGYPKEDELVDFSQAILALIRGDLPAAIRSRDRFVAHFVNGKTIPGEYLFALDPLITATHGLDLLERLTVEQEIMTPYSPEMLGRFRAWDEAGGLKKYGKSPRERAEDMEKIDIRAGLEPIQSTGIWSKPSKAEFLKTDEVLISCKPGYYNIVLVGLPGRNLKNVHIRMECWLAETGPPNRFNNNYDFSLVNLNHSELQRPETTIRKLVPHLFQQLAGITFDKSYGATSQEVQFVNGGGVEWRSNNVYHRLPTDASRSTQNESPKTADGLPINDWYRHPASLRSSSEPTVLDFFRVDGGVQLLIDGRTVVHMPVDPEIANVGYYHRLVGCELKIKTFRAWELKEK